MTSLIHAQDRAAAKRSALLHPLFLVALTLLLLNDHVLKSSGWLPGIVTGKLSDFAGLIVAPVFAGFLFKRVSTRAPYLAAVAVIALFCGLQLAPGLATGLAGILGALGFGIALWPDPTDLVALSILPVTWWLLSVELESTDLKPTNLTSSLRHRSELKVPKRRGIRAVAIVSSFACVATSPIIRGSTTPVLVNHSKQAQSVLLSWYPHMEGECSMNLLALAELQEQGDAMPTELSLDLEIAIAHKLTPLSGPVWCPQDTITPPLACLVVRIDGEQIEPHIVRFQSCYRTVEPEEDPSKVPVYELPPDNTLILRRDDSGQLQLVPHGNITLQRL